MDTEIRGTETRRTGATSRASRTREDWRELGEEVRERTPWSALGRLSIGARDPLGILERQNALRLPDLVPLRRERMAESPFAFYRGTAAIMAADLGAAPHSGIVVASCGDAHISNFGFYASPMRTLLFDLNDFDEAAWAPWEWDLKRLVTSVVIGGQATERDDGVVTAAAHDAVRAYAATMAVALRESPLARYYTHFDVAETAGELDKESRRALKEAVKEATRRTGERAARRLTSADGAEGIRFVEDPPRMTHVDDAVLSRMKNAYAQYERSAAVDIRMLLRQYEPVDVVRRVVGVGSVGTRCYITLLRSPDDDLLVLQVKQAGRSVLEEYGGIEQPAEVDDLISLVGQGGRVVGMQRILQAVSDPFLGHMRTVTGDFYVRQFHDMKGSIDPESLSDAAFHQYAQSCAVTLARAHSQSAPAGAIIAHIGEGDEAAEALTAWARAYADLSRADYAAFVAAPTGPDQG